MVNPNGLAKRAKAKPQKRGLPARAQKSAQPGKPPKGKAAPVSAEKPKRAPAQEPQGDTEKRILAAARKEFIAKGLDGARMQAVATEAGVNKALLHYYYRSKEKLYQRVLEDTLETIWGRLVEEFRAQDPHAGLEPLLRTVVTTYVHTLAANPEFPLFMFRELASSGPAFREGLPQIMRKFQDLPATMARVLAEEAKAGKIKPIAPIHFFMNMLGMTVSTFLLRPLLQKLGPAFGLQFEFGEAFMEERIRSITDTMLNGIRIKR